MLTESSESPSQGPKEAAKWRRQRAQDGGGEEGTGMLCWHSNPARRFKHILGWFVLASTTIVGVSVWWFVTLHTGNAVDDLSWRMTSVVRLLAVEQALSFFAFPQQAVGMMARADLADVVEVQSMCEVAFETTSSDAVKVGLEDNGGFISYTLLAPVPNVPAVFQVSSNAVNGTWTEITTYAVENSEVQPTPLSSEPFTTKSEPWYQAAVTATGDPVWHIGGTPQVPVISYSKALYGPGGALQGVVAADLVVVRFITNVIDFLGQVSPRGVIYVTTLDGLVLVTSAGISGSPLVDASLTHLTNVAGGSLASLDAMDAFGSELADFQVKLEGEEMFVMWESISQGTLRMQLVMVLSRQDFREEIDGSYRRMGLVVAITAPIVILASLGVSSLLVKMFVKSIRNSLNATLASSPDTGAEEDDEASHIIAVEAQLGKTPMTGVVQVLVALRSSLPSEDRRKLNAVIHRLVHSRAEDLYTPQILSSYSESGESGMGGLISLLRSAADQQPAKAANPLVQEAVTRIAAERERVAQRPALEPTRSKRSVMRQLSGLSRASRRASQRFAGGVDWTKLLKLAGSDDSDVTEDTLEAALRKHLASNKGDDESASTFSYGSSGAGAGAGTGAGSETGLTEDGFRGVGESKVDDKPDEYPLLDMDEIDDYFDDPGVKPPLTGADVAGLVKLLEKVDDWGFDIHEFAGCVDRPLVSLMMYLLNRQGLVTCPPDGATDISEPSSTSDVPVSWQTACAYFTAIEEGYATCIQYHTARHGADTIHGTNYCLHQLQFTDVVELKPLDYFSLLFAAAVHDFRHVGVNNNFLVTTSHPLAVRYNDKSVLENFHVSSAFQLMGRSELNLLAHFSQADRVYVRNLVIGIVLATDLAMSYDVIGKFKLHFCSGDEIKFEKESDAKEAKELILKMAMKCCDVASGTKPFPIHNTWTHMVTAEFFMQGDAEKELGLPVLGFMDREECNLAKSQQGFLNFVVKPIYTAMSTAFPRGQVFMKYLMSNIDEWKEIEKKEEAAKAAAEAAKQPRLSLSDTLPAVPPAAMPQPRKKSSVLPKLNLPRTRSMQVAPLPALPPSTELRPPSAAAAPAPAGDSQSMDSD